MDKADLLYKFLVKYFLENGYAPTYQEMVKGIGVSSKSVIRPLLIKLWKRGLINLSDDSSKFSLTEYKLVKKDGDDKEVLYGTVNFPSGDSEVCIRIKDKQIELEFQEGFDTSNWYHAVYITHNR